MEEFSELFERKREGKGERERDRHTHTHTHTHTSHIRADIVHHTILNRTKALLSLPPSSSISMRRERARAERTASETRRSIIKH